MQERKELKQEEAVGYLPPSSRSSSSSKLVQAFKKGSLLPIRDEDSSSGPLVTPTTREEGVTL